MNASFVQLVEQSPFLSILSLILIPEEKIVLENNML